jgi:hypothetical protein
MNRGLLVLILIVGLICVGIGIYSLSSDSSPNISSASPPVSQSDGSINILLTTPWMNTGVTLKGGERLVITATGRGVWKNIPSGSPTAYPKPYEECGPDGTPPVDKKDYYSNISDYQCAKALKGALIGKVGENGLPFPVGSSFNQVITDKGILYLGINDLKPQYGNENWADNSGSYTVRIQR